MFCQLFRYAVGDNPQEETELDINHLDIYWESEIINVYIPYARSLGKFHKSLNDIDICISDDVRSNEDFDSLEIIDDIVVEQTNSELVCTLPRRDIIIKFSHNENIQCQVGNVKELQVNTSYNCTTITLTLQKCVGNSIADLERLMDYEKLSVRSCLKNGSEAKLSSLFCFGFHDLEISSIMEYSSFVEIIMSTQTNAKINVDYCAEGF